MLVTVIRHYLPVRHGIHFCYYCVVHSKLQATMESIIKWVIEWISVDKISVYKGGLWLFALLACIEVPVCIRLMAKLRNFVLQCREKRNKLVRTFVFFLITNAYIFIVFLILSFYLVTGSQHGEE